MQETIHRAGEDDQLRRSGGSGSGGGGSGGGSHIVFFRSNVHSAGEPTVQNGFALRSSVSEGLQGSGVSSHHEELHYVNGTVSDHSPQYVNTGREGRSASGAFQIDESAPLIGFMDPSRQCDGFGGHARVNYADLDLLSSMENIPGEEDQGAGDATTTLYPGSEATALPPGDPDVFTNTAEDLGACRTYINIKVDEPSPPLNHHHHTRRSTTSASGGEGDSGGEVGGGGDPSSTIYTNLTVQGAAGWTGGNQQQKKHTASYILLDFQQSSDNTGTGGAANQSLSSPTGGVPLMETSSYAEIDFNKTEALCNSTKGGAEGEDEPGARKTRHNSTIDM